eukprot:1778170-Amphidinium_carterae.1
MCFSLLFSLRVVVNSSAGNVLVMENECLGLIDYGACMRRDQDDPFGPSCPNADIARTPFKDHKSCPR